MTLYLLDTNILSDLVRNPQGKIFEKLSSIPPENIATSIIVSGELRFGAAKKASESLTKRVEDILSLIQVWSLDESVDLTYAAIRKDFETKGTPIGGNDLWIAAHVRALSLQSECVLVTANTREFERIDGLNIENWLS